MKQKKKIQKKIRWRVVLKFFLFIFIFIGAAYYVKHVELKRIIIHGTEITSDYDIIMASGLKDYPFVFDTNKTEMKSNVLALPTVEDVKIKRTLTGSIIFDVKEAVPLFYNRSSGKTVLSDKKEVDFKDMDGIPVLVNYVPDVHYERLILECQKLDKDVLNLISEIEYQPWKNKDVIIDDTRFLLRMSDGNQVFVNLIHMDKLNRYMEIYATLENKKGYLYLDSSSDKISFSLENEDLKEKEGKN